MKKHLILHADLYGGLGLVDVVPEATVLSRVTWTS